MDPLNPKATRSSAMPAQPRGRVGRSLIPGGLLVISLVAAWYWFRAGTREGLPEARARILLADIEVSLGSCAETVPHGIRAFVKDRSAELATPIALVAPLRVDFERHAIARRPPSEGKRSDQLMTGGDRVNPARIWDRADGRVTATFDGSADNDGPARLSDDGTRVYIGSRPGDPGVWRVRWGRAARNAAPRSLFRGQGSRLHLGWRRCAAKRRDGPARYQHRRVDRMGHRARNASRLGARLRHQRPEIER